MILSDGYSLTTFGYDGKDEWTSRHGCEGKVAEEEGWRGGTVHHAVLRRDMPTHGGSVFPHHGP